MKIFVQNSDLRQFARQFIDTLIGAVSNCCAKAESH